MSLNYKTIYLGDNFALHVFEAPHVKRRIFLGIYIVAWADTTFVAHISFDDPQGVNYLTINNLKRGYEFECVDIPQGIVFIKRISDTTGSISAIEILK